MIFESLFRIWYIYLINIKMKITICKTLFFITLLVSVVFLTTSVKAAGGSPWVTDKDEIAQELKDGNASVNTFGIALISNAMGTIRLITDGATTSNGQNPTSYNPGATGLIANLTSKFYEYKPASSIDYLADLGTNLGLIKPTYAQGIGFTSFSSILPLWKLFRDVSYLLFIVIFAIFGLMIMFRKKIDPRTVVTLQDALPRIVITLLLITFSYAISGLMVDLGDLLTRFIGGIFGNTGNPNSYIGFDSGSFKSEVFTKLFDANTIALVNPLKDTSSFSSVLQGVTAGMGLDPNDAIGKLIIGASQLIFSVAAFFVMFKIFFALLTPYVTIVIQIILSPIQLLLGVLPGNNNSVTSWLKSLLVNILVFPVTFGMLAIIAIIKGATSTSCTAICGGANFCAGCAQWGVNTNSTISVDWAPAVIGKDWGSAVGQVVAFGMLFMVPNVVEMVRGLLQQKAQPWEGAGAGIGKEISGIAGRIPVVGSFMNFVK